MAITYKNIAVEESATVTARVATVEIARGSTNEMQEILVVGDPQSSLGMARVLAAVPGSTEFGLVVRVADPSTGPFAISSIAGVSVVRQESTAWQVQVGIPDQGAFSSNTTFQLPIGAVVGAGDVVAGKAGALRMSSNRALWTHPVDSSGGLLSDSTQRAIRVTSVDAPSTGPIVISSIVGPVTVRLNTSSGAGVEGSTTTQSTGSVLGINTREVQPSGRQSTSILVLIQTAGGSTTLVSSVAGLKHCVFAYSVMSTIIATSSCAFLSSLGTAERWGLLLGTGSSGITGANLAINPPGFIFQTNAADPLGFSASSSGLYRVSISWFTEA